MAQAEATTERAGRVSTLELFFDLVFVFTITQLTALLAAEPDAVGLAKVVVLLLVIWWMYDGYAWLTNALALDVVGHRLLLIGGMGGFLLMALAIPTLFEGGGVAFGLGYLAVVVLHTALYIRETSAAEAAAIRGIVPYNVAAALLLVAAGIADGAAQWVLVVLAAVLVWSVPAIVSLEGFEITASHFVERHALVVIVALGESVVVLGVGAEGAEVGLELALIALLGLALSAALWWTYFGEEQSVEHALLSAPREARPRLAIMFSYLHVFLLLGIVLVAAGLKKAIAHPFDPLDDAVAVLLAVGTAVFVAADTAFLRVLRIPHGSARALAATAALATIPLGLAVAAAAQVAALVVVVAAAAAAGSRRRTSDESRARDPSYG